MPRFRRFRYKLARAADDFAQFTVDVIYDRRHGRGAEVMANVLYGLSFLFSLIVQSRLHLYEHRILRNRPLGCLVVVVGNLTVGGTGKTPVCLSLIAELQARGATPVALSRGHGGRLGGHRRRRAAPVPRPGRRAAIGVVSEAMTVP